jgi:hypothetical protein
LKGADFVDMSLPSYGDAASTGKEKSVFSLWEWFPLERESYYMLKILFLPT